MLDEVLDLFVLLDEGLVVELNVEVDELQVLLLALLLYFNLIDKVLHELWATPGPFAQHLQGNL